MFHCSRLQVWQRSHKLVLAIYRTSQPFPDSERFGLTSQLRRAASSVPTNNAEGLASKEYAHFLNIAEGSLSETEYLLILGRDLGYIQKEFDERCLGETSEHLRMLHGLPTKIQKDNGTKSDS